MPIYSPEWKGTTGVVSLNPKPQGKLKTKRPKIRGKKGVNCISLNFIVEKSREIGIMHFTEITL